MNLSRKARVFAAAVSEPSGVSTGRSTDPQVRELVHTAEAITRAASWEVDPDFVVSLRTELMTEADTALVAEPAKATSTRTSQAEPARRRPKRRLAVAAAAALIVAMAGGTIASSTQAMPGEILYPVKLQVESAQSGLHFSDISKGDYELELASTRLDEVSTLVGHDADPELITTTLERFTREAGDGAARLFAAHEPNADDQPVDVVQEFAESANGQLSSLRTSIPDQASPAYREALATLRSLSNQVSTLCDDCDSDSMSSIRSSVSDKANKDPGSPPKKPSSTSDTSQKQSDNQKPEVGNTQSPTERPDKQSGPESDTGGQEQHHDKPRKNNQTDKHKPSSPGLLDPVTGLLNDLLG